MPRRCRGRPPDRRSEQVRRRRRRTRGAQPPGGRPRTPAGSCRPRPVRSASPGAIVEQLGDESRCRLPARRRTTERRADRTAGAEQAVSVAAVATRFRIASPLSAMRSASRSRADGSSPASPSAAAARRKARSASAVRCAAASASMSTAHPPSRSGSAVVRADAAATASSIRPAASNAVACASRAAVRRSSRRSASARTPSTSARSPNAGPSQSCNAAREGPRPPRRRRHGQHQRATRNARRRRHRAGCRERENSSPIALGHPASRRVKSPSI